MRTARAIGTVLVLAAVLVLGLQIAERIGDNGTLPDDGNTPDTDGTPVSDERDADGDGLNDATARVTPVTSESKNMIVTSPDSGARVGAHALLVSGSARVFENQFNWIVRDADGAVLAEGQGYAYAPDTGEFGAFAFLVRYSATPGTTGTVEVFDYSARDGSVADLVRIPVVFGEDTTASVFLPNAVQAGVGNECTVVYARERQVMQSSIPSIVLRGVLAELLSGATADEAVQGYQTSIPEGVRLQRLQVATDAHTVTLDFSANMNAGGSCRVSSIRRQVEQTVHGVMGDDYQVIITVDGGSPEEALQP